MVNKIQKSHKVTTFFANMQIFCAKSAIFLSFQSFSASWEEFYAIFERKSPPQRLATGAIQRFYRSAGRSRRYFAVDLLIFGTPGYRDTGIPKVSCRDPVIPVYRDTDESAKAGDQKENFIFSLKMYARTCVYEIFFVILHAIFAWQRFFGIPKGANRDTEIPLYRDTEERERPKTKQTKNINKHANNQTETWFGHSV